MANSAGRNLQRTEMHLRARAAENISEILFGCIPEILFACCQYHREGKICVCEEK